MNPETTVKIINKFHFGVYAVVLRIDSILLVKKSRGPYIGKLDLPGGKPEYGETPIQTVKREILEETGVVAYKAQVFENYATVAQLFLNKDISQENTHHIGMIYLVTDYDDAKMVGEMNKEDSLGAEWHKLNSLAKENLSPFALYAIADINRLKII